MIGSSEKFFHVIYYEGFFLVFVDYTFQTALFSRMCLIFPVCRLSTFRKPVVEGLTGYCMSD